jgi:hypothetical protein
MPAMGLETRSSASTALCDLPINRYSISCPQEVWYIPKKSSKAKQLGASGSYLYLIFRRLGLGGSWLRPTGARGGVMKKFTRQYLDRKRAGVGW